MIRLLPKDKRVRMALLMVCDIIIASVCAFLGLYVRFDLKFSAIPMEYWNAAMRYLPFYVAGVIASFSAFRLYSYMWSLASFHEIIRIFEACILATLVQMGGMLLLQLHIHRSYFILCFVFLYLFTIALRFSYRFYVSFISHQPVWRYTGKPVGPRIMIVGAGAAGNTIGKELLESDQAEGTVVCYVDDNDNKVGKYLNGIIIAGSRADIPRMVEKYRVTNIYIALPTATPKDRKEIIEVCQSTGCKLKVLPGIYQLLNGEVSASRMRDVEIDDLLGREPVVINQEEIFSMISGKTILVTGGGGSIGSELCRQIASHAPKKLIVFDIYENSVYDLQQELKRDQENLNADYLIGSVRNEHRLDKVFEKYQPDIVFHAAAHKHVPLMEMSPNEAIKNNVFGTYNVARMADKHHADTFVLISTDKAVNPTNIMGASKRLCEMIIQMMARRSETKYVAVRFGNVLGSNGSVVHLFKQQLLNGGPLTVTHPDIIRYFMTIPEAVQLVLQAGAYASGGEIFVLDMGEPVKIMDLAKNMIKLSGYKEEDIKIEITGLRPGEKLYEEMLMDEEGLQDTANKLIHVGKPIVFDDDQFEKDLQDLKKVAYEDTDEIREHVAALVPTYHPKTEFSI